MRDRLRLASRSMTLRLMGAAGGFIAVTVLVGLTDLARHPAMIAAIQLTSTLGLFVVTAYYVVLTHRLVALQADPHRVIRAQRQEDAVDGLLELLNENIRVFRERIARPFTSTEDPARALNDGDYRTAWEEWRTVLGQAEGYLYALPPNLIPVAAAALLVNREVSVEVYQLGVAVAQAATKGDHDVALLRRLYNAQQTGKPGESAAPFDAVLSGERLQEALRSLVKLEHALGAHQAVGPLAARSSRPSGAKRRA